MKDHSNFNSSLSEILSEEGAHIDMKSALKGLTVEKAGTSYKPLPYTIWQLMEHIRITLWDIVKFSEDPGYVSPDWPEGYWPKEKAPGDQKELENSLASIIDGKKKMTDMVSNAQADLLKPFSHGQGQNLLREAVLIVDHTAYHLGQIVLLRRLLNDWK